MPGYFYYYDPGKRLTKHQIETALHINSMLAWRYHLKYRYVPKEDFVSLGLVAVAECLNAWKKMRSKKRKAKDNFGGFVKVCIQNEYGRYLKREVRKDYLVHQALARVSKRLSYTSIRSTD